MNGGASPRPLGDLIYDVGMHEGEDTDFYLKKGFRVVAFEADPELAGRCRARFGREIAAERLTIVEGAIVEPGRAAGSIKFYRNLGISAWGTVNAAWAERNGRLGTESVEIEVATVDFAASLARHGVPYFMKIDIEGCDRICLEALAAFEARPSYLSIESEKRDFEALRGEFEKLEGLGYDRFKAVQQETVDRQREPTAGGEGARVGQAFKLGSSGLFGKDLPGEWKTRDEAMKEYARIFALYRLFGDDGVLRRPLAGRAVRRLLETALRRPVPGWFDTHARHTSAR